MCLHNGEWFEYWVSHEYVPFSDLLDKNILQGKSTYHQLAEYLVVVSIPLSVILLLQYALLSTVQYLQG